MNDTYNQICNRKEFNTLYDILYKVRNDSYTSVNGVAVNCYNRYDLFLYYIKDNHQEFYDFFNNIINELVLETNTNDVYNFVMFIKHFSFLKGSYNYMKYVLDFYLKFYDLLNGTNLSINENTVFVSGSMSYILYSAIPEYDWYKFVKPLVHPIGFYVDLVYSNTLSENISVYRINNNRYVYSYLDSSYEENNNYEMLNSISLTNDTWLFKKSNIGLVKLEDI